MRRASLVCAALLLLAACGSTSLGDLGSILGSPSASQSSDVQGVVNSVDSGAQRIDLDTRYVNNLKTTQTGQSVYWDSNTRVVYRARTSGQRTSSAATRSPSAARTTTAAT